MYQEDLVCRTNGEGDILNLSEDILQVIQRSGISDGIISLYVYGSTAALTTIEYEPGVLSDLLDSLKIVASREKEYAHDRAWGDGNGRSHVRASLIGPSLVIPVSHGALRTGRWQQPVLVELDIRDSRERTIVCTVSGT
ncbi:secondary thiamine-phosphate synthase enzyme YjbQ [Methanogenium organophilum]|uniref:Secondary thiamine-phosphate synthase enzyme YjbQ n=1 Tax=Methanogenium organophilum TaxID=2199 RepID=A0A9X9S3H2_METOG|nr:secondary thiamine-phosphate synthase enzyme YjbQ [Methanogenium organophilum]WAI01244.1 secondary thiamine-phosphate synthase enzyme YjbQ [Methanogenium organophilum]